MINMSEMTVSLPRHNKGAAVQCRPWWQKRV